MSGQFERIEKTLKLNVQDVYQLVDFDRVILDFAISALETLRNALKRQHGIVNPALTGANALQMLQGIRKNDSLRPRYEVIFNQCVVLLVSVFASAVGDLFRDGVTALIKAGRLEDLRKEELQFSIGELEEMGYELTERLGHLLAEKRDISFQDMKSIRRAFRDYFSVDMPKDRNVHNLILAQAARHIIVHDAGKISERFVRQVSNANPRDLKSTLIVGESIQFNPPEVRLIGDSMLQYFSTLRSKVEKKLTE